MTETDQVVCPNCGKTLEHGYKFCSQCGKRNPVHAKQEIHKDWHFSRNVTYLGIYAIFTIILLLIAGLTEDSLDIMIVWTVLFAAIDLIFAILQPEVWRTLLPKVLKVLPLLGIIAICIISGFLVSFVMKELNLVLFNEPGDVLYLFEDTENPLLIALIIVAVCPALFEELAFRGFVFNNINHIAGKNMAIWGSAFLFGLVHFSLLSLIWIFPFGLLLGYYRNKYNTLIYGIVGHFTHNATTVLIEYYGII